MFAAEFESVEPDSRRRAQRAPVSLDVEVDKAGRTLCKVLDISIHGCRIQTYSALTLGDAILLTIPGVGSLGAAVIWAEDYEAGCQFREPLTLGQFEVLIERDAEATKPKA